MMSKTLQCFKCRESFQDPNDLFVHVKTVHKMCGKASTSYYRCTCACSEIFDRFGTYQTHVRRCFDKMDVEDAQAVADRAEINEAHYALDVEDEDVKNFRCSVEKAAFQLACKLNAIMMMPRDLVYKELKGFSNFLQETVVNGIKTVIVPRVPSSERKVVKEFMDVISSSFSNFGTEWLFEKELKSSGLISPFDRCLMSGGVTKNQHCDPPSAEIEEETSILMPISFQIKKFFELPGVFKKIMENTENIQRRGKLNHFINGSLWKEKMKNFDAGQIVIPYHYYSDGAQLNHPLGPHIRKGSEDFQYYFFPTVPPEFQPKLENIFPAYLFPEKCYQDFSLSEIFGNVIEELTKLATEGILVNVDSTEYKVYFVCGAFLADNKEANITHGFGRAHSANRYCRYCQISQKDAKKSSIENPALRRNRSNYNEDLLLHSFYDTGIHEYSPLNNIPFFHVTESSAEDLSHTVEEGIVKYNLSDALSILIYRDKLFTLEELNRRIKEFSYSPEEKSNKPHTIFKEHLDKSKFRMTQSEAATFVQHITFIIGDLVPEENEAWQLIQNTVKFFDFAYLPCYEEHDLIEWSKNIEEMNDSYIEISGDLKPVQHIATHFPSDTRKFGPMRYTRTIRCEAKHQELKAYAKNSNNRIFISLSIAKKVQYNFAERLLNSRGFVDLIEATFKPGKINEKVYFNKLQASADKDRLVLHPCLFTDKLNVNGMQVNRGTWIPDVVDDGNDRIQKVHEIFDIVTLSKAVDDFFLICKTYSVMPNNHFVGYEIDRSSVHNEFVIVNVSNFLTNHHYPIVPHKVGSQWVFRCKRF